MSTPTNLSDYEKVSIPPGSEGSDGAEGPNLSGLHDDKGYTNGLHPAGGVAIIGMGNAPS